MQTSMGIAGYKNAQSPEQLYEFADKALYSAKADGRNGFKIDKVS
ncbi:diguanylate cyclase domain-containing protein [Shewanella sp.]